MNQINLIKHFIKRFFYNFISLFITPKKKNPKCDANSSDTEKAQKNDTESNFN